MKKNLLVLFAACFINISLFAQTVTIGTSNTTAYSIFNMQDPYTRHATVYSASEIGTTGTITSLGWNLNKIWSNGDGPVKIYLIDNVSSTLSADTWANIKNGATLVYDNIVTFPTSANNTWFTINLSTPFAYSSGNLMVLVESNYGGSGNGGTGGDIDFNCTANIFDKSEFWWGNPIQTTGSLSSNRPVIQLTFSTATGQNTEISTIDNSFSVFPNPATQTFYYATSQIENADLMIFDMQGNQVYSENIGNQTEGSVDISLLPKGCYIVRIMNDKLNLYSRLMIQ
jgi:hypothetical protein